MIEYTSLKDYAASKDVSPPFSVKNDLYPKLEQIESKIGDADPVNQLKWIIRRGEVIVPHT
jgi:hypothetical protein